MSKLKGTILASGIVPTDSLDTYPTHSAEYGKGGHRSVDTLADRDNISIDRREEGMSVYVKATKSTYTLEDGLTNDSWVLDTASESTGGVVEFESLTAEQREMIRGPQGLKGDRGLTGFKGDSGLQGIKGDVGPVGPPGPKGDKGDKGDQGLDGTVEFASLTSNQLEMIRGEKGDTGPKGDKGDKGDTGATGADGTVEFAYLSEAQKESLKGDRGEKGDTGLQGPKGDKGDKGDTGADGNVAFDLLTESQRESLVGPQGIKGDKGDQGIQGIEGPRGQDGNVSFDLLTASQKLELKGDKGDRGEVGESGPQGIKGDKGDKGQDGTVSFELLTPEQRDMIKGDIGPIGPQGPKGDIGLTGPQGPKGTKGDQGIKGDKGDTGAIGPKGDSGDVSFSELTPEQIAMLKGDKGDTGPKGDKGDKGDTGAKGIDGNVAFESLSPSQIEQLKGGRGDRGEQGPVGPQGEAGPKGDRGDIGPQGPRGLTGVKGDSGDVAFSELTPEQVAMLKGDDAYEVAVSEGYPYDRNTWLESLVGEIKFETLTEDQKEQLLRSEVRYGSWSVIPSYLLNYVMTPDVTKLPIFNTKIRGNLVASNENSFFLRENRVYKIEFSIGINSGNTNFLRFAIYNDTTNTMISTAPNVMQSPASGNNYLYESFYSDYIRVDVDTPISIRMESNNNTKTAITIPSVTHYCKINIMEMSTREMILSDFSINGKKFDENNNIDLEGLSTLSNPILNQEVLTEHRHPVSKKREYVKAIYYGTLPNATNKFFLHGVVDAEDIKVDLKESYAFYLQEQYPIIWTDTTASAQWRAWTDRTNVGMKTGFNATSINAYIVLRYTKTTDSVNDPVRLVGGSVGVDNNYELAVKNGVFVGTLPEYLEWSKGPQGIKGDKGDQGVQGPQGPQGVDGNVAFESLTENQKLELLNSPYFKTRYSSNLLIANINTNEFTIAPMVEPLQAKNKKIRLKDSLDSEFDFTLLREVTTPSIYGDYKIASGGFVRDIFKDGSCKYFLELDDTIVNKITGNPLVKQAGGTAKFVAGKFGKGIDFTPGDSPIYKSTDVVIPTTDTVSISMFMKCPYELAYSIFMSVAGIDVSLNNQRVTITIGNQYYYIGSTVIPLNQWFHLVVIGNPSAGASNFKCIINGVNRTLIEALGGHTAVRNDGLIIGNSNSYGHYTYKAEVQLDNLRVFNRAITDAEISVLNTEIVESYLQAYHGLGKTITSARYIHRVLNTELPIFTNEIEAKANGLEQNDLYYDQAFSLKQVK